MIETKEELARLAIEMRDAQRKRHEAIRNRRISAKVRDAAIERANELEERFDAACLAILPPAQPSPQTPLF